MSEDKITTELETTERFFINCYKEIKLTKSFLSIPEGHIGFYEIQLNKETQKLEALVYIDARTTYNVPEDFFEEVNPTVKIID